jgi:hypothetical protein
MKNLSLSSYVLFDIAQFLYEHFFFLITSEIKEIFQEAKVIALFRGSPATDSSAIKKRDEKGNHMKLYDTVPLLTVGQCIAVTFTGK